MRVDLEKEHVALKMQANLINNRGMTLLLAAEVIQEYRNLVQQLMMHNDKLHTALNENENPQPDGGSIPATPPKAA